MRARRRHILRTFAVPAALILVLAAVLCLLTRSAFPGVRVLRGPAGAGVPALMHAAGTLGGLLPRGSDPLRRTVRLALSFDDASGRRVFNATLDASLAIHPDGRTGFRLRLNPARLRLPFFRGHIAGAATGNWRDGEAVLRKLELRLLKGRIRAGNRWIMLPELTLAGNGVAATGPGTVRLRDFRIMDGSRTLCRGDLALSPGGPLKGRIDLRIRELFALLHRLNPDLPFRFAGPEQKEPVLLQTELLLPLPDPTRGGELQGRMRSGFAVALSTNGAAAELPPGSFSLKLKAGPSGSEASQPVLSWAWRSEGPAESGPFRAHGVRAEGRAHFTGNGAVLHDIAVSAEGARLSVSGRNVPLAGLELAAPVLRLERGRIAAPEVHMGLSGVGELDISLRAGYRGREMDLVLRGNELSARGILDLLAPLLGSGLAAYAPSGSGHVNASVTRSGKKFQAEGRIKLRGLSFSSPRGSLIGQDLAAALRMSVTGPKRAFEARFGLEKGEALWGSSYFDFQARPITVSCRGALRGAGSSAPMAAEASWQGLGGLQARGDLHRRDGRVASWSGRVALQGWKLAELASVFGPTAGLPESADLTGTADFHGSLSLGAEGFDLWGTAHVLEASARFPERQIVVRDAALELPVRLQRGRSGARPEPPEDGGSGWGVLDPGRITWSGRGIEVSPAAVALRGKRFLVRDPIRVSTDGAELELHSIAAQNPLASDFELRCGLRVERLEPGRFTGGTFPVQGRIGGELSRVRLSADRLTTAGSLRGTLFRGDLSVEHIAVARPFDESRTFSCTAEIDGLNLTPLSRALDVGRITGLLDVRIEDLRIAYGQPVHFALRAESVPASGVPQTISLKAVNALSIIGTGRGLSGLGVRFYANFFEKFPYKRIGVACTLNNDVFSLSGLIHEDGVEYLVKRPLFGINVINTRPRNKIAFSDMLRRIRRIAEQPDTEGG